MKKILSLLLALLLLLSLAGCGNDTVRGSYEPSGNTDENDATDENQTSTSASADTSSDAASDTSSDDTEEGSLTLGSNSGGVYRSEFLGITCTLDDSWTVCSDEEILQLNEFITDDPENDLATQIAAASVIYDLYAMQEDGTSLNIVLEKVSTAVALTYSVDDYIDASISSLKSTLESSGCTNVTVEKKTLTFLGSDHTGLSVFCEMGGVPVHESMVALKKGQYFAVITSAASTDTTDDLLALFTELN